MLIVARSPCALRVPFAFLLAVIFFASIFGRTLSAESNEADDLAPGLVVEVQDGSGRVVAGSRIDEQLTFDWGDALPDLRLAPGEYSLCWSGFLLAPETGTYVFRVRVRGSVRWTVDGVDVVTGSRTSAGWLPEGRVELEYGTHEVELLYEADSRVSDASTSDYALGVYWESEKFALEPVGDGELFHRQASRAPNVRVGYEMVSRLGCAACHDVPTMSERYANWKPAPSLARVGGDLQRDFLAARLKSPAHAHPGSRMPEFEFTDDEVEAIVAALRSIATTQPQPPALEEPSAGRRKRDVFEPSATTGRRLVKELGCLACHTLDGVGLGARFAGGSLDQAGVHRSRVSLARWLDPSVSGHRPSLRLRPAEREHIVHYLISRSVEENDDPTDSDTPEDRQVARGLSLIRAARCGACHELPGDSPTEAATPLHSGRAIDWIASCLEKPSATNRTQESNVRRPYYILTAEEQRSIRSFLTTLRPETVVSLFERGRRVVREAGCLHCHRRGPSLGLVEVIPQIAFGEESLRGLEGALRPPSVSAVGDKFADRSRLSEVIVGHAPERRPWLRVRMPRYRNLPPREATALAAYLVASDFVPEVESSPHLPPEIPSGDLYAAGHHLVGGRGFGCSSCHALGSYTPKGVAPNVQGPNLKSIGQWLRKPFFLRWMRDPSRIVPGVEMPTVPAGMSPLLAGRLDRQMEALWFSLNSEKFSPPPAFNFVREVDPLPGGEAVVVRDVFRHREPYGDGWTARAFAVGFPTGQHVLYDLDWLTPRSWWAGQFASEFTSGKTWLWEPAGTPILPHLAPLPPIALRTTDGTLLFPAGGEQVIGVFKGWRRVTVDGVEISYALRFASGSSSTSSAGEESESEQETLDVRERIRSINENGIARGFERRLVVEQRPRLGHPFFLTSLPVSSEPATDGAGGVLRAVSASGPVEFRVGTSTPKWVRLDRAPPRPVVSERSMVFGHPFESTGVSNTLEVAVRYVALSRTIGELASRRPAAEDPEEGEIIEPTPLALVPGFEAVRLPFDNTTMMPTSFAFPADGSTLITSLKGDVIRLTDTDADGLEDEATRICDYLAAPFGLALDGDGLIVCQKPELLRLSDSSGDGFFETAEIVAAGWGYSRDYHDWLFGLVTDGDDYVALLASDYNQAGRSRETTRFRGKAIRISRQGEIHTIARGMRYAVGIAKNRDGEIFFTDNQGVGNTFNEINHLREGKAYGVPSLYDPATDRTVVGEPAAVNIPHPWVRSVNGISFLDAGGRFGPYEGHGIGCEYDNQRLIRFSLQRVGETYQGAAYPFSVESSSQEAFLGPISCAVRPDGVLYVGNLRDSGWGGANNLGSVVRLRLAERVPFGIREVRARSFGFEVEFTSSADVRLASDASRYTISAYRRVWKGAYSSPDQDRHVVPVSKVVLDRTRTVARLHVKAFREGFLYEIYVRPWVEMWPREAYYTLNVVPRE